MASPTHHLTKREYEALANAHPDGIVEPGILISKVGESELRHGANILDETRGGQKVLRVNRSLAIWKENGKIKERTIDTMTQSGQDTVRWIFVNRYSVTK